MNYIVKTKEYKKRTSIPNGFQMEYFQEKGLHILHFNVSSLLPKINEIRFIAKQSNASITEISESKLDSPILNHEIDDVGYNIDAFLYKQHL